MTFAPLQVKRFRYGRRLIIDSCKEVTRSPARRT